jgi:cell division protein FtsW
MAMPQHRNATDMQHTQRKSIFLLHMLLALVAMLLVIGLIFIYSASSVFALSTFGTSHYYLKRHLIGLCVGFASFAFIQFIPLPLLQRATPFLFYASLLLSAATLLPIIAHTIHGSSRWLTLCGFSFQPSELLKVTLPLYVSYFLEKNIKNHRPFIQSYIPLLFILGSVSLVLLKQPDFGLTMTLLVTTLMLLFVAQCNLKHIMYAIGALGTFGLFLIAMRPYRIKRLLSFLDPWHDPQGSGFQIIQSLIAIGSGHVTGMGIGNSKQKFFYLPMQHTDFIFSIIAEETGFIGCLFLILLYVALLYVGISIALQLPTIFAQLTVIGYMILISLQTIINLAVTTGLAPTKGIGLPFISYGNTALVCNIMMIGIITHMVYES